MFIVLLLCSFIYAQQLTQVEVGLSGLNLKDDSKSKIEKELSKIKNFEDQSDYRLCSKQSVYYLKKHKQFKSWVYIKYLECLSNYNSNSSRFTAAYDNLKTIDQNANWFLTPSSERRLTNSLGAYLLSAIDYYSNRNEEKLLLYLNQMEEHRSWVFDSDYAKAYFLAAKHFKNKKPDLSKQYAEKSYSLNKESEVKDFIAEFEPAKEDKKTEKEIVSKDQKKLLSKMSHYNRHKQWISLSRWALKWNNKYPVSDYTDRVNAYIYRAFYNSFESRLKRTTYYKKVLKQVLKNEPQVLASILDIALKFDKYDVYYELSKLAYLTYPNLKSSKLLLSHYAASSTYTANYKDAVKAYQGLYNNFKTSKDYAEISFKYGLSLYRTKDYKKSFKVFSSNIQNDVEDPWRLSSLYWAWRSSAKESSLKANSNDLQEKLINEYPMTYYGLKARVELDEKSRLSFPKKLDEKPTYTLYLNKQSADQLNVLASLIRSGWLSEASDLINDLFKPSSENEKIVTAKVYSQADDYFNTIKLIGDVLDKNPEFFTSKVLSIAYPKPFYDIVSKYSKIHNLDSDLVLSLIKQESSFNAAAQSPVGAQGLMQIVRITANEIARDLRVKGFRFPDKLQEPYTNIRFGTYYIKKLLRANKQHIPMALACYNAGIGNIWRWVRARWDLAKKLENHSSLADDEIWIDELPWIETNYYVKSILRNFLIYKILNNKIYQVNQPVWQSHEI